MAYIRFRIKAISINAFNISHATRQFTDIHFEDSSPTYMYSVAYGSVYAPPLAT